jgi:hypothetical protein
MKEPHYLTKDEYHKIMVVMNQIVKYTESLGYDHQLIANAVFNLAAVYIKQFSPKMREFTYQSLREAVDAPNEGAN